MSTVAYKRIQNALLLLLVLSAYFFDKWPDHQLLFGGAAAIAAVVSMVLYFRRDSARGRSESANVPQLFRTPVVLALAQSAVRKLSGLGSHTRNVSRNERPSVGGRQYTPASESDLRVVLLRHIQQSPRRLIADELSGILRRDAVRVYQDVGVAKASWPDVDTATTNRSIHQYDKAEKWPGALEPV